MKGRSYEYYLLKHDLFGNVWKSYLVEYEDGNVQYLDVILNGLLLGDEVIEDGEKDFAVPKVFMV